MRGGGKKWLEIGDDMAFGCVLGLPMCLFVCLWRENVYFVCFRLSDVCGVLKVALCTGTCTSDGENFDLHPPPRS